MIEVVILPMNSIRHKILMNKVNITFMLRIRQS